MRAATKARLDAAVAAIRAAEDAAYQATVAVRRRLDAVEFALYETRYTRRGRQVECPEIDEIERHYNENVAACGFLHSWTREGGSSDTGGLGEVRYVNDVSCLFS